MNSEILYYLNPHRSDKLSLNLAEYRFFENDDIFDFHKQIPSYTPTPLVKLEKLAKELSVGEIWVKDESHRFNLNAFKALGAPYAIYRYVKEVWEERFEEPFAVSHLFDSKKLRRLALPPFCTATDGNHGRAVAWFCRLIGQQASIYLPAKSASARKENIAAEGAQVLLVDGTYDDAVARCAEDAKENGWIVIADTAYGEYVRIPRLIMAGYTTIFEEIDPIGFDLALLQAGVGSMAASAVWYYRNRHRKTSPKLVSVEPIEASCLLESAATPEGRLVTTKGKLNSIMAGLNCGTPSTVAWPILREGIDLFMAIPDSYAEEAMRSLFSPKSPDPVIVSGESGAAGLGALLAILNDDDYTAVRVSLGIDNHSRVLLFNTEGATDPCSFDRIIKSRC